MISGPRCLKMNLVDTLPMTIAITNLGQGSPGMIMTMGTSVRPTEMRWTGSQPGREGVAVERRRT